MVQVFTVPLEERRFKEMLEKPQFGEKGHEQVYNKIKGFGRIFLLYMNR